MCNRRRFFLLMGMAALAPGLSAQSGTLRIAAAADLEPVLPPLISNFEKSSGVSAEVSYAASATLAMQILNGAPFDLFLAANRDFPQKVVAAGLAVEPAPITYARGTLVLWARAGLLRGPLAMQSLTEIAVRHVAIANPRHAPYGAAAMAAIHRLGLMPALQPKLVYAENIAQAAQFGQSGNAECALISKTIAITQPMRQAGEFVLVPETAYKPIEQGAVVMRHSAQQAAALKFLQFIDSAAGRQLLAAGGLTAPE